MAVKMKVREHRWYGWKRSLPDFRDRRFMMPRHLVDIGELPTLIDLRHNCPPAMDQGPIGSCVAHGVTAALRADRMHQGLADVQLSRLQLYYDARVIEGTVKEDAGLEIRDAIKCAAKIGVGPERLWPYIPKKFARKPPLKVYRAAKANEALEYRAVDQTVHAIKAALASGHPVVFGISVYESFDSKEVELTGTIPMPKETERMQGGHCMYLHSYDDKAHPDHACGRNSWGTGWGINGDFLIPWAYLTNEGMASDFWIITEVG